MGIGSPVDPDAGVRHSKRPRFDKIQLITAANVRSCMTTAAGSIDGTYREAVLSKNPKRRSEYLRSFNEIKVLQERGHHLLTGSNGDM